MSDCTITSRLITTLAIIIGGVFCAAPVEAQHPQSLPPIAEPTSVYAADLDGDGDADVLSASLGDGKIAWYQNEGAGQFSAQKTITTRAHGARAVSAADLDGDGDTDVLSASQKDGKIAWYENDGDGDFSAQQVITTDVPSPWDVTAADFNGDGDPDVLAVGFGGVAWMENRLGGAGTDRDFGAPRAFAPEVSGAVSACATDLDEDGDPDVVVAARRSGTVAWHENDGTGSFAAGSVIADVGSTTSVHTADLDGDGDRDVLFTADGSGDMPEGTTVAWAENRIVDHGLVEWFTSSDDFGAPRTITTKAQGPQSVYAADVDGDGATDVLSASEHDDTVAWYRNEGAGTFSEQKIITDQAVGARSVHASDLDGDEDPDVLSATREGHTVAWHRNEDASGFSEPRPLTAGFGQLQSWTLSDLDRDGDSDVVAASEVGVFWYENTETGGFPYASHITDRLREPAVLTVDDLDGDGHRDVIVGSKQQLFWFKNGGADGFYMRLITSDVYNVTAVAAADLDNDDDRDVVAVYSRGETLKWYENTDEGFSSSAELPVGPEQGVGTLRKADLDGDGDPDLLISTSTAIGPQPACCVHDHPPPPGSDELNEDPPSDEIRWYENTEEGFVRHAISDETSGTLRAADLDGDGDVDVVAQDEWYENDGRGRFASRTFGDGPEEMRSVAIGDLNGDGHPDLLTARPDRDMWYKNDGTGTFTGPVTLTPYGESTALAVADVNGDGRKDVVSARSKILQSFLTWYVNTGDGFEVGPEIVPPPAPSDLTARTTADGVTLRWTESGADDLKGYVIYRSTSSFGEAPPDESDSHTMSGTPAGTTTYTDTDLRADTTYYYEVVAQDWDNNESRASREVKVEWSPGSDGRQ